MNTDIKQAMHVEAGKSFGTAEANENERHWNDDKIDRKNQDPTNHYDKTRMKLNFEIGPDGKVHPLGYQEQSLEVRLQKRLAELGWKPFKPDSKIQPNCCAKFVFGGNHDRTIEMAFGNQTVNFDKEADNSHLHRCEEIEQWAKDVYDWCARRYGQENIIGFQVHLDESSPHIHALIVPVGQRAKSGRECVMWSAKFGKSRYEYGRILREMHTSLHEEVGSKYGLERGDSIEGQNVSHLNKRDYIRKLSKDAKQAEPSVRERIFTIADALIGGQPVAVSSGGGGGNSDSDSDLRWDGRRPDEEEEAYRRRCLLYAIRIANKPYKKSIHR